MPPAELVDAKLDDQEPAIQQDYKEPRTAFGLPLIKSGLKKFHRRFKRNRNEKTMVDAARRVV